MAQNPVGLKVPTWITLKELPNEFMDQAKDIASSLGEILGEGRYNQRSPDRGPSDQKFCVAFNQRKVGTLGWEP
jgi:hypothetical protein